MQGAAARPQIPPAPQTGLQLKTRHHQESEAPQQPRFHGQQKRSLGSAHSHSSASFLQSGPQQHDMMPPGKQSLQIGQQQQHELQPSEVEQQPEHSEAESDHERVRQQQLFTENGECGQDDDPCYEFEKCPASICAADGLSNRHSNHLSRTQDQVQDDLRSKQPAATAHDAAATWQSKSRANLHMQSSSDSCNPLQEIRQRHVAENFKSTAMQDARPPHESRQQHLGREVKYATELAQESTPQSDVTQKEMPISKSASLKLDRLKAARMHAQTSAEVGLCT